MSITIDDFKEQKDCVYKDDRYSVRDNGAVLRHPRQNRIRKLDNQWTFGNPNGNGYLLISSEVVHRIVAYAFLGEPPTPQHVIDHLDTNRQNNRPDNLRWLTKLENILNNPITVNRIIYRCGSIEAFIKDPSILKRYEGEDPNYSWMKTVTAEEARISWENLNNLGKKVSRIIYPNSQPLEDWIYTRRYKKTEKERLAQEQVNPETLQERIEIVMQKIEKEVGLSRAEFTAKNKKQVFIDARIYAANQLRLELDLSEETIGKLIGLSKSMVNTYLNYREYFRASDFIGKIENPE